MTTTTTPPDADHRAAFRAFVLDQAEAWHRAHLGRLYALWDGWNAAYFAGQLAPPESPKALGDCASISSFGGRCQIRVRPSLLVGTHPHVRQGDAYAEGRFR